MANKEHIRNWLTKTKNVSDSWFQDNGVTDFMIDAIYDYVSEHKLKPSDGNPANSENANCAIFDVSGSLPDDEAIKKMALKYRPQQDKSGEFWRDGFRECYLWLSGMLKRQ